MDAFEIHRRLIEDYRGFTSGFVDIADERIHDHWRTRRDELNEAPLAAEDWGTSP